jgi:hypothetical protein
MTSDAMCFRTIDGSRSIVKKEVLSSGQQNEMIWIHAYPVFTSMVNVHPFLQLTFEQQKRSPVSCIESVINRESPIAGFLGLALPFPTSVRQQFNLFHKGLFSANFARHMFSSLNKIVQLLCQDRKQSQVAP